MRKNRLSVFGLVTIFGLQIFLFFSFKNYFEAPVSQQFLINDLVKKNKQLQTQVDFLQSQKSINKIDEPLQERSLASLSEEKTQVLNPKKIDLSEFYFSQLQGFKQKNDKEEFLRMIDKIQSEGFDVSVSARAEFEKISYLCDHKISLDCTHAVDTMISQFPDSNWTAKSLLVLSHYYFQQNKLVEAKSLLQIIKSEFKTYNDFAYDIKQIKSEKL